MQGVVSDKGERVLKGEREGEEEGEKGSGKERRKGKSEKGR